MKLTGRPISCLLYTSLSAQPENFMPAPELILLEEAAEYPLQLMNEAELERYIRNREEIINSVLGDGH